MKKNKKTLYKNSRIDNLILFGITIKFKGIYGFNIFQPILNRRRVYYGLFTRKCNVY